MIEEMLNSEFINEYGSRQAIITYQRIARWGTCVECPRENHIVYPEHCLQTDRRDHQLTYEGLVEQYMNWKRRMHK